MAEFHRIKAVEPETNYNLIVTFQNDEKRLFNTRKLLEISHAFTSLFTIPGLFEQVKVDTGGYGVSWNSELDIACDDLYFDGEIIA